MSLLSAIHASRTGLLANTRRAEIVSSNIANAQDENYSRRSLSVTEGVGGGVQVLGVSRAMNTAMDALFRSEMSYAAKADVMSHSLSLYTIELGDIDSEISLPAQLANFENTLGLLSNAPENANLQQQTLNAAEMLTQTLRDANSALGQINTRAVDGIATDVKTANATLEEIARINTDIAHTDRGTDAYASLEDRLSAQLDKLSEVIEIDVTYDTEGRAKVHTAEGQTLVFASYVNELSFDRAAMALYAGTEDITPGVVGRRNSDQGSIAGHFELMGEVVPQMQIELDEIARSLIEGFEDADASLAPGQAGLFTDRGFAYDPANQSGLAGRIAVNAAVDPQQGGELYRLRDRRHCTGRDFRQFPAAGVRHGLQRPAKLRARSGAGHQHPYLGFRRGCLRQAAITAGRGRSLLRKLHREHRNLPQRPAGRQGGQHRHRIAAIDPDRTGLQCQFAGPQGGVANDRHPAGRGVKG